MLKRLDKHIILAIFSSTLVVLLAFLSIDFLAKTIDEIDILGRQQYDFFKLTAYVLGLSPLKILQFFPMALLIGALMGLGRLSESNELMVMQTAGVSRLRLASIGFLLAVVMGAAVLLMAEFVGVAIKQYVVHMRAQALGEVSAGGKGVWAQQGNDFVEIGGVKSNGELVDIRLYRLNEKAHITSIITAKSARLGHQAWVLFDVEQKNIAATHLEQTQMPRWVWKNDLDSRVVHLLLSNPDDLSIRALYRYIRYQQANDIKPTSNLLIFWQRLFLPLSAGVMFLLALPFVFTSGRHSGQGSKLLMGVLLGLLYYIAYTSIANLILLTNASPLSGALLPIVLFAILSFGLMWWWR